MFRHCISKYSSTFTVKRHSIKPWIDAKILKLVRIKRSLWRVFKRSGNEIDFKVHRNFWNKSSTIIKNSRAVYEKRIADQPDVKSFYKQVRNKFSGPVITPQLKDDNGRIIDNSATVADIFGINFPQVFTVDLNQTLPSLIGPSHNVCLGSVEFPDIIVRAKLGELKLYKSPRSDNIGASILQNCADSLS